MQVTKASKPLTRLAHWAASKRATVDTVNCGLRRFVR